MSIGANDRMEHWVIENEPRAIAIRVILRNENLKAKHSFLVNALTNKNDAEPAWNNKACRNILGG